MDSERRSKLVESGFGFVQMDHALIRRNFERAMFVDQYSERAAALFVSDVLCDVLHDVLETNLAIEDRFHLNGRTSSCRATDVQLPTCQ